MLALLISLIYIHTQVYTAGVKNIDLYFIITEVAGPVILMLSLSVVLPYVLAEALISIPGDWRVVVEIVNYLLFLLQVSHIQCNMSYYELFIH